MINRFQVIDGGGGQQMVINSVEGCLALIYAVCGVMSRDEDTYDLQGNYTEDHEYQSAYCSERNQVYEIMGCGNACQKCPHRKECTRFKKETKQMDALFPNRDADIDDCSAYISDEWLDADIDAALRVMNGNQKQHIGRQVFREFNNLVSPKAVANYLGVDIEDSTSAYEVLKKNNISDSESIRILRELYNRKNKFTVVTSFPAKEEKIN